MKKHFLLSVAAILFAAVKTIAQTYAPVVTTGYTLDGVAENTTAIANTTGAMDNSNFNLYTQYYGTLYNAATAVGLPNNGTIVSGTRTYQLQNYNTPNTLLIPANGRDSLTFVTPQPFPAISLLSFATQGNATMSITVRFTDNTTQVYTGLTLSDWFTAAPNTMASGFDRVLRTTGVPAYVGSAGNPKMFGTDLAIACANQGKLIKRVTIQNTSIAFICVMAVSGNTPPYSVTPSLVSICNGANVTLNATGLTSYTWEAVGAFTGSNSGTITVSPSSTTSYTLSGDNSGCPGYTVVTVNVSSGTPTVSLAGSTQTVCLGAAATITASGAITYTLSSPAANGATFAPAATTIYTVTGANGCGSHSVTTTITVSPLPITATAAVTLVCTGSPATLTAGGGTTYTWMPGSGSNSNYITSPLVNTTYTITGKTGNCIGTNTIVINTKPLPTMSISSSSTAICNGGSTNLTVNGTAVTFTWNPGALPGSAINISPIITTFYSVSGTGANGCNNSASQLVTVYANPVINVGATAILVCTGGSSTLSASGASTYLWNNATTANTLEVFPATDETYSVTGTSANGCSTTTMISVSIYIPTFGVSSNTAICSGANVTIGANSADTYTWVNDGSNNASLNVHPAATTVYTVNATVTDLNSGLSCPASNTLEVVVNPNPTITASTDHSVICRGNSAILTGGGAGAAGTYTLRGGPAPVMAASATVSPILDQTYTITGVDANSCKGTAVVEVKVSPCTGIAANEADMAGISVYPNPSNGDVTITSALPVDLVIMNELGQLVRSVKLNDTNGNRARIESLSPGVYFVSSVNSSITRQKILITK